MPIRWPNVGQAEIEILDRDEGGDHQQAATIDRRIVHSLAGLRRGRNGGSSSGTSAAIPGRRHGACGGGAPLAAAAVAACAGRSARRRRRRAQGGGRWTSALAGSWNQLWRQPAQRTLRPAGPIALSGTT